MNTAVRDAVDTPARTRPAVRPILDDDIDAVAGYLHRRMNARVPAASWAAAMRAPWQSDPPNHGFQLRRDGDVVGAYVALYSNRQDGRFPRRVCNLAAWCVDDAYRFSSTRLLQSLLAQPGYEFVDLSPSGNVIALNERLGFRHLDTTTALVPVVTLPALRGARRVTSDPARVRQTLEGRDLAVFLDHEQSPAARHLLLSDSGRSCHLMYRRDRRKGIPAFATVLHVSDPDVFVSCLPSVRRHLAVRGFAALLCETRLIGGRPPRSTILSASRPKMFKGAALEPGDIDNLYSELTEVAW